MKCNGTGVPERDQIDNPSTIRSRRIALWNVSVSVPATKVWGDNAINPKLEFRQPDGISLMEAEKQ